MPKRSGFETAAMNRGEKQLVKKTRFTSNPVSDHHTESRVYVRFELEQCTLNMSKLNWFNPGYFLVD